jgi:uncharacterized PurR-regulated membrane protein YhhQ (DUF165 family)
MKIKEILKNGGKNLLAIVVGGIVGMLIFIFYGWNFWLPNQIENLAPGLETLIGAIALIGLTIILFSILGMIVGGVLGLVFYQILKRSSKKKRIHQNL